LGDAYSEEAQDEFVQSTIGNFYADFFRWVNLLGMFLQLFVVGRLVKLAGVRAGLIWLPIVALGTYGLVLFLPILRFVRIGKTVENASDYSINKTTVQMLFLPTSRDVKYKAKQAIDSFFHRVGDVGSAILVFVGTVVVGLDARGFALVNILFIVGWVFLVRGIVREHREIEAGNRPELTGEEEELAAWGARLAIRGEFGDSFTRSGPGGRRARPGAGATGAGTTGASRHRLWPADRCRVTGPACCPHLSGYRPCRPLRIPW
jgi:ATP/ADP translocase